jgi:hypothetical protein
MKAMKVLFTIGLAWSIASLTAGCGGTSSERGISSSQAALDDPGTTPAKEGEGAPAACGTDCPTKDVPPNPEPVSAPSCTDKGYVCTPIVDKNNLCPSGLDARWELSCSDNEVCCGDPLPPPPDPCGTDPNDTKCGA